MRITEVFIRGIERHSGQQWFEVWNDSDEAMNLRGLLVQKRDGKKRELVWQRSLPEEDCWLQPGEYGIIAQRADLGQNLCSGYPVVILKDLKFHSQGVQEICLEKVCAPISDSKSVEKGFSRNLISDRWAIETCELKSGFYASPGLAMGFCNTDVSSAWTKCPATNTQEQSLARPNHPELSSCEQTNPAAISWLMVLGCLLWHFKKMR
ncbi:MAG: hypothetical protein I8H75_04680 [Myxococcaceae bacterium]|nr:hypothetical protein [Myxococcaceae bacterium]MBH2006619.1 hypothetical protein [Myxococcaceae bacterium]